MNDTLFREQFKEIKPLKIKNKVIATEREKPRAKLIKQPYFAETITTHKRDINKPQTVVADEFISFHQSGVQARTLKQLKQGLLVIHDELDLHGYTLVQAELIVEKFIDTAYHKNARVVSVIHGKGRAHEHPPIKNAVNMFLQQNSLVLAFSSVPAQLGGTGVVHVLLKRKPST